MCDGTYEVSFVAKNPDFPNYTSEIGKVTIEVRYDCKYLADFLCYKTPTNTSLLDDQNNIMLVLQFTIGDPQKDVALPALESEPG